MLSQPETLHLRYLLNSGNSGRAFLRSVARIMIAYRTGAMEYGLLTAGKPA